jgi:hypothetical protein
MSRYNTTNKYTTNRRRPHYGTTKYPVIPLSSSDIYVITQEGDRFDQLALQYYGDSSLWWVIACSNPGLKQNSYYPPYRNSN